MITKLRLHNWKSFEDATLYLAKLMASGNVGDLMNNDRF